jgi:hypothetical protein
LYSIADYISCLFTGVALLLAAAFFGYMLALLQRRVLGMVSTEDVSSYCFFVCEEKKIMSLPCQLAALENKARAPMDHGPAVPQQAST